MFLFYSVQIKKRRADVAPNLERDSCNLQRKLFYCFYDLKELCGPPSSRMSTVLQNPNHQKCHVRIPVITIHCVASSPALNWRSSLFWKEKVHSCGGKSAGPKKPPATGMTEGWTISSSTQQCAETKTHPATAIHRDVASGHRKTSPYQACSTHKLLCPTGFRIPFTMSIEQKVHHWMKCRRWILQNIANMYVLLL